MKAPLPENEAQRLQALERYQVLDTPREEAFDRITTMAARLFDVPMALVSLVDQGRQWWKSCVGVDTRETSRDIAFCAHAILSCEPLIVEDAREDPRFADNPFVTGPAAVRFYAGAPLTNRDGFNLGTLCLLDTRPRHLSGGMTGRNTSGYSSDGTWSKPSVITATDRQTSSCPSSCTQRTYHG